MKHASRRPVGDAVGIGPVTSAKMNALGLYIGLDMRNQSLTCMQAMPQGPESEIAWRQL